MSGPGQRGADASPAEAPLDPQLQLGDLTVALTPLRLLTAIGIASAVHLLISWGLLVVLTHSQLELGWQPRVALIGTVVLTGALALATARVSARRGLTMTNRTTPAVFGLAPPLASLALSLVFAIGDLEHALDTLVPLFAAATAPGLVIALTLEHALSALAARVGAFEALERRAQGTRLTSATRPLTKALPLASRLARLITGIALATCLLALAQVSAQHSVDWIRDSRAMLALLATGSVVIAAIIAAASAGSSPGRDVQTLAERLDAIGWEPSSELDSGGSSIMRTREIRPLETPVRVTSFDAVGGLFANLERLRARLARDVDTYERALDETHAVDAAKRDFLAAVSHELRTPLNSILGFAQLLLESELTASQAEDVRLILAGGRQLSELIEDILDLSMIESGELELRFAPCRIDALIEELVELHQAQVRERKTTLSADVRGPIPEIICDRRRVGQVITNLLSNAIKFTEDGGVTVSLSYDRRRERVAIAVADTGVGIAMDQLEAIFEEYQQVGAPKRKIRGTGLGLAIAKQIAEAHGGVLSADSRLDFGSTFTLRLPVAPPEAAAGPLSSSITPATTPDEGVASP